MKRSAEQRSFDDAFATGCEFWTGEDGYLTDLVIARVDGALDILKREHGHTLKQHPNAPMALIPQYAYRIRNREEETGFSDLYWIWQLCDAPTKYPVYVLHLFPDEPPPGAPEVAR